MDLYQQILNGQYDDDLADITEAIRTRKQLKAKTTVMGIKVGDTVRFSTTIRPKYLVGLPATVVKRNRESVVVSCPNTPDYGRFAGGKNIRCSNILIEGLAIEGLAS